MHYYEYFQWLCQSRNISEADAYKGSGINKSSVSRWRTAYEEGRDMNMSSKAAAGLSSFFKIPIEHVFAMEDEYGLSATDWEMMGQEFRTWRERASVSLDHATDNSVLTIDELRDFEDNGHPLTLRQLDVICGLIHASAPDVFAIWANRLYGQKNKPTGGTDGLSEKDIRLVEWFRSLPEGKQKAILDSQDAPEGLV